MRGGRILLTHDARTIPRYADERVRAALGLPGVVVVAANADLGEALADLRTLIAASSADEWPDQVRSVPLR